MAGLLLNLKVFVKWATLVCSCIQREVPQNVTTALTKDRDGQLRENMNNNNSDKGRLMTIREMGEEEGKERKR
jgi:hypothetical protein